MGKYEARKLLGGGWGVKGIFGRGRGDRRSSRLLNRLEGGLKEPRRAPRELKSEKFCLSRIRDSARGSPAAKSCARKIPGARKLSAA